uniref:BED-type domain-containing protein n=1 Tax=Setaria digitata TaxID=48799 RepID=A0A915PIG3_9BILA
MISTKTVIKDEFTKANGLEYKEECDMDVENDDDGSSIGATNEVREEIESTNDVGEEENDGGTASTSGSNNLFLTEVFTTKRHKPNREAKILETSIANLKKKLQTQGQTNFSETTTQSRGRKWVNQEVWLLWKCFQLKRQPFTDSIVPPLCYYDLVLRKEGFLGGVKRASTDMESASVARRVGEDPSQITCRSALRISNDRRTLEIENYLGDSFDEGGQTAVERSLAAMTKSKCLTSSRNPFDDVDNDDDNDGSKNDAFLDRIFGESGTDSSGSKNSDYFDGNESFETSSNPGAYISSDITLSAALRRKRQRRNPVWPYFIVKDGMANCKHCNYSTKSVFSTNLKSVPNFRVLRCIFTSPTGWFFWRITLLEEMQEVLKAEEEQQEQITLQNSLLAATCTTTTAATKTPYMHHVTTTALPAVGRRTGSAVNTTSGSGSNLNSAAVLLGILNQTGSLQGSSVGTTTATATTTNTAVSSRTSSLPTTPRSILDFPKAFSESQLPLDYLKTTTDLTRNLPDFLKVISEASAKSAVNPPLSSTKTLAADNERLKTLSKISQNSPSSYNITYGSKTDKITSPVNCQSAIVLKRRRLRRHPVWRFFKDVGDGSKTVKCVNCPFSTSSPFSTNLKMHLKAHHKSDYRLILILESRQRLEEGISPIPESVQVPPSPLKKKVHYKLSVPGLERNGMMRVIELRTSVDPEIDLFTLHLCTRLSIVKERSSSEDTNISSTEEEQTDAKKRSLSTGAFEDEGFTSMTNTERVKAMIEMAAASQTQSVDLQYPDVDYATVNSKNSANSGAAFGSDEGSSLVDTNLLMRLGLAKSDLLPSKPPLQNKFLNTQLVVSGSAVRNHLVNSAVSALDTTKSVRTISKRLPTGEVVKVRQTRKSVENPVTHITANTTAAATATINTTKPIVPSRDLTARSAIDEQLNGIKSARDIALAKFLLKANVFHLLDLPEFKQFVDSLDPTYQIPQSGYLKRLLESTTGAHDLSSEHLDISVQEQE